MEKTLTITKGRIHQKVTDQAGNVTKGVGIATRMAAQGITKSPQDKKGELRKEMRIKSTKTKATADERS
jgi:hypothetical protein